MSIDRKITRLTPVREPDGDRVPVLPGDFNVVNERRIEAGIQRGELQKASKLLKTQGEALLETGNHWKGMPQLHQELRSYAETAVNLGSLSGPIQIDVARANVFYMTLTGNASISLSQAWPKGHDSASGIDVSASLLIQKGSGSLSINTNHWGPEGEEPDLSRPGFYEISLAICAFPTFQVIRAWPSIVPPEA